MYQQEQEIALTTLSKKLLQHQHELLEEDIEHLKSIIKYADWKYYVQSNPVIADIEYDILFKKLIELEHNFPHLKTADSPTQRISQGISNQFPTVQHWVPMLSLNNSYNPDDLTEWDKKCKELLKQDQVTYTVEPKYDGTGISLYYENGMLVRGVTRGDGIQGEDITPNIKQIKAIPLSIPMLEQNISSLEIRGEVIIPTQIFKEFNATRIQDGLEPLANPRNAASGSLRMLDPKEVAKRGLTAILYHISYYQTKEEYHTPAVLKSHYASMQWLHQLGFVSPIRDAKLCNNIEEVIQHCYEYEENRDNLPFEIDGMVVKVNLNEEQDKLGMTTHHPRWAMAYKFKARQNTSTLLNVEFQIGRTGVITPVAKIEAVQIGGVSVTSVSLFNEDNVRDKDLRIGDKILVERAGDVIPYIVKSFPELRSGNEIIVHFPENCPTCNEGLFKEIGEVAWRCINMNCPSQVVERIIHFASKDGMDIRNLGNANAQRFFDLDIIKTITNIYELNPEQLQDLSNFGKKSIDNLLEAIEKSKSQSLNRLIFGLGIRFVGETTAKTLSKAIHHILELKDWSIEQLTTLEDIGPKVANSVHAYFQNQENIHTLELLEQLGVNVMNQQKSEHIDSILDGKTFLFTGTLSQLKRSAAEQMVEEKGGKILGSVSSKLNYLVVGEDAGSKLEKAKKLGNVHIITEQEFIEMIN